LKDQFSGYILAIGASIPEFTTNLISAVGDSENRNIGLGAITGSGSYGNP
jgi:Ca2+/Na+ antiporter